MRTIEEILACVDSCTHADICDSDKHWCIYGDTGPDCVDRLEVDYEEILGEVKKISTVARLKEICDAEHEGRLVVLPYPIGAKVYIVIRHGVLHDKIIENVVCGYSENEWQGSTNKGKDSRFVICHNSYNMPNAYELRDVFLTRSEAEESLKGVQNGRQ